MGDAARQAEPAGAPGRCPICCDPVGQDRLYCQSCNTPHHTECWRFAGMCAIYGCGSELAAGSLGEPLQIDAPVVIEGPVALAPGSRKAAPVRAAAGIYEMRLAKKAAFRDWLRSLLDASIAPQSYQRSRRWLRLWWTDQKAEETRRLAKLILLVQLVVLPLIVMFRLMAGAGLQIIPELALYLSAPALVLTGLNRSRRLAVDGDSGKVFVEARSPFGASLQHLVDIGNVVQVAIWHELRPDAMGERRWASGIFLQDQEFRRIPIVGFDMCLRYEPAIPDALKREAQAIATFLGLPYGGIFVPRSQREQLSA